MANTLKFGNGEWATKKGSTLAYNDTNGNYKPLPFTFDRAGSATRVNKQGLIEVVSNNEPRIDFLNDSKGALLLEPSRSNLIEQSNNFSAWSVISNVTLDADSSISPDGENTATKIIPNSSNAIHQIRLIYSSATNTYNFSVFAKKGEYKNILIWDDTVAEGIGVNLDDLSIFRNENVEGYKIEQHSNGWVRISYTRSYTSEQPRPSIYVYDNSATPQITFSGNGSDGLYLWGAQFEIGSYATSLIPTQGSIGTRVQEENHLININNLIGVNQGSWFLDWDIANSDTRDNADVGFELSSDNNQDELNFSIGADGNMRMFIRVNGAYSQKYTTTNKSGKWCLVWNTTTLKLFQDGLQVYSDEDALVYGGYTTYDMSANIQYRLNNTQIFNTALTDEEAIALTTL